MRGRLGSGLRVGLSSLGLVVLFAVGAWILLGTGLLGVRAGAPAREDVSSAQAPKTVGQGATDKETSSSEETKGITEGETTKKETTEEETTKKETTDEETTQEEAADKETTQKEATEQRPPAAVRLSASSDEVPQTDGKVSAIAVSGDRIYLGGSFTQVDGVRRNRLAAIDADTGQLTGWDPGANGQVRALAVSADGSRVYAGGVFTVVGKYYHDNLAAIDAATGAVDNSWNAGADRAVYALKVSDSRLYVGGKFQNVNGYGRSTLALLDGATGALDPSWAPATDGNVRTIALSPDEGRVYVGGNFSSVSGETRPNLAAVDRDTGAVAGWTPNPLVDNDYEVFDLKVTSTRVHVAGGGRDPDGTAESFDAATGESVWRYASNGDFQAVTFLDGRLYFGGHFTTLFAQTGQTRRVRLMAVDPATGALGARWTPEAVYGGVWSMALDPARTRVYAGGDFTEVSGRSQQGFALFSAR